MRRLPHPIDDVGRPVVPEEYQTPCEDRTDCNLDECLMTTHHIYPRRFWENRIDRKFGELACNKVRLCRELHTQFELDYNPPEEPSRDFKVGFIKASGVHISSSLRKEMG